MKNLLGFALFFFTACNASTSAVVVKPAPVKTAKVQSLTITTDARPLSAGQTRRFIAYAGFADGSSIDVTDQTIWIGDGAAISMTDAPGVALGRGEGSAMVHAIYESHRTSMTIEISSAPLATLISKLEE